MYFMSLKQRDQLNSYIKDLNRKEENPVTFINKMNNLDIVKSQKQLSHSCQLS